MSFGGAHGKDTGSYVNAAKDAIATMAANTPEITIKDDEQNFNATLFKEEYEKIYTDVVKTQLLLSKRSMSYLCIFVMNFFAQILSRVVFFADSWRIHGARGQYWF
jgi:hypothetical protein